MGAPPGHACPCLTRPHPARTDHARPCRGEPRHTAPIQANGSRAPPCHNPPVPSRPSRVLTWTSPWASPSPDRQTPPALRTRGGPRVLGHETSVLRHRPDAASVERPRPRPYGETLALLLGEWPTRAATSREACWRTSLRRLLSLDRDVGPDEFGVAFEAPVNRSVVTEALVAPSLLDQLVDFLRVEHR